MEHQLTFAVPDEVYQALTETARASGQTVEDAAGACLARMLDPDVRGNRLRRWGGAFTSGVPDAGSRHDDYLGQALAEAPRGEPDA
jgi:hypothetical protein